jgi:hypothetical protein
MAISKYTPYKYVKVDGTRCYCKAAYHDNGKIKADIVFVNVKQALLVYWLLAVLALIICSSSRSY